MKIGTKSILDGDQSENVSMIRIVLDLERFRKSYVCKLQLSS
jgi:hypothetical protein